MITVREAIESDVEGIRDLFLAAYGQHYAYPEYYDISVLKGMVFDEDTLFLVAEDDDNGRILGTASVIFDLGEYGDLIGEFGRLVVHPDGRKRGIGKKLMEARIERARNRLHLGFAENRVPHPFSQRISHKFGFAPAGFLPEKHCFKERESLAIYVQHFGDALKFRRNNPRVIPEGFVLAQTVLSSCHIDTDAIVDDHTESYPDNREFELEALTTEGYAPLLRFQRARAGRKEILGRARIHQGMFRLKATHSHYVIARDKGQIVGGIGYTTDEQEKTATIFELVSLDPRPVRMMLNAVIENCRKEVGAEYIETDVSAYSPAMQRTLLELRFMPVGYFPAFSFIGPERLDAIRMARLFVPLNMDGVELFDATKPVAEIVLRNFTLGDLVPRLAAMLHSIPLFAGLTENQVKRLADVFSIDRFSANEELIAAGKTAERAFVILEGEVKITAGSGEAVRTVGRVSAGECLGETAFLADRVHSVSASAVKDSEAAVIDKDAFLRLIRRRPDIGIVLYKNLAESLGGKLRDLDAMVAGDKS